MGEINKVTSESVRSTGRTNMTKRARKQDDRDSANWPITPVRTSAASQEVPQEKYLLKRQACHLWRWVGHTFAYHCPSRTGKPVSQGHLVVFNRQSGWRTLTFPLRVPARGRHGSPERNQHFPRHKKNVCLDPRGEALCCSGEGTRVCRTKSLAELRQQEQEFGREGLGGLEAQQGTGLPSHLHSLTISYG